MFNRQTRHSMKNTFVFGLKATVLIIGILCLQGCVKPFDTDYYLVENDFVTENVIVVLIDGPRFSETWGHPEKKYIPFYANEISPKGVVNQEFYNFGNTQTISGHTASITGVYELMNNNGLQYPSYPSFMQYYLAATQESPEKAWIITAKKKLEILGNCSNVDWRNNYLPMTDAVDRSDAATFERLKEVMTDKEPTLLFVNLSGPDKAGHQDDWDQYLANIVTADSLLNEIVKLVDTLPHYKGKTTLFMSNDHGRHLDGVANGFVSHGDLCHGCTHINFFAYGPDFRTDTIYDDILREQIDIVPTIGHLLGYKAVNPNGNVMTELFK